MADWNVPADPQTIEKTIEALKANNINAELVASGEEAKKRILEIIPEGAEVMTMLSMTLEALGIPKEVQESGKYNSVKNKLNAMDRETERLEMKRLGAAPEWAVGSVHAVTEEGEVVAVSNTGSQLPAYAYGSLNVIWVVGTQKIVKNLDEAMKRVYDYVLPLESDRLNSTTGTDEGSFVSKILIFKREMKPGRTTVIFVPEILGF